MVGSNESNYGGKTATFVENESIQIPTIFPPNLTDPGSFFIPCIVGEVQIERGLWGLGASLSIMAYSLFHKLHQGPLLAAPFSLQLADGSVTQPISRLEDVPVNIKYIWVLEDFIIVDMCETDDAQTILGRPILAIAGCYIDVRDGCISFKVKGEVCCV